MNAKTNSLKLGIALGVLIPIITFALVYFFKADDFKILTNIMGHQLSNEIVLKLGSLSVIPNLLFFFVFIYNNALKSARGVLASTFFYGILIFVMYYFW